MHEKKERENNKATGVCAEVQIQQCSFFSLPLSP